MATMKRAVLVYQGGLANVFEVKAFNMAPYGRDAKRLMQADFHTCETFAHGLKVAGVQVKTAACNQAGNIAHAVWSDDADSAPFADKFCSVGGWLIDAKEGS